MLQRHSLKSLCRFFVYFTYAVESSNLYAQRCRREAFIDPQFIAGTTTSEVVVVVVFVVLVFAMSRRAYRSMEVEELGMEASSTISDVHYYQDDHTEGLTHINIIDNPGVASGDPRGGGGDIVWDSTTDAGDKHPAAVREQQLHRIQEIEASISLQLAYLSHSVGNANNSPSSHPPSRTSSSPDSEAAGAYQEASAPSSPSSSCCPAWLTLEWWSCPVFAHLSTPSPPSPSSPSSSHNRNRFIPSAGYPQGHYGGPFELNTPPPSTPLAPPLDPPGTLSSHARIALETAEVAMAALTMLQQDRRCLVDRRLPTSLGMCS